MGYPLGSKWYIKLPMGQRKRVDNGHQRASSIEGHPQTKVIFYWKLSSIIYHWTWLGNKGLTFYFLPNMNKAIKIIKISQHKKKHFSVMISWNLNPIVKTQISWFMSKMEILLTFKTGKMQRLASSYPRFEIQINCWSLIVLFLSFQNYIQ